MLEFLTLFLGLVVGPNDVALRASSEVARVTIALDGREVAELEAEPWHTRIDFGDELLPHRMLAVAYDAKGAEIDRVGQQLNMPRLPAEVSLFLERSPDATPSDPPAALRLDWESRTGRKPDRMLVRLNDRLIVKGVSERVDLPPLDAERLHLIEVELGFRSGVVARRTIGFGGPFMDELSAELTAIPVTFDQPPAPEAATPPWSELHHRDGRTLPVIGVDLGEAEVVFVAGQRARASLQKLVGVPDTRDGARLSGVREAVLRQVFKSASLGEKHSFRVLIPQTREVRGRLMTNELFPMTASFGPGEGGVLWHVSSAHGIVMPERPEQLADALASAANQAATGNKRRAVVLVLGAGAVEAEDDVSRFTYASVKTYLDSLRVPLVVWYVGKAKRAPASWGEVTAFTTKNGLEKAVESLRELLDRQRIVWLEGSHLPSEIELPPGVEGARLPG